MTPNGKPSRKLKIPCANNTCGFDPHHRHKKETPPDKLGEFPFYAGGAARTAPHDIPKEASRFCRDVSFLSVVRLRLVGSSDLPYSTSAGNVFCLPYLCSQCRPPFPGMAVCFAERAYSDPEKVPECCSAHLFRRFLPFLQCFL